MMESGKISFEPLKIQKLKSGSVVIDPVETKCFKRQQSTIVTCKLNKSLKKSKTTMQEYIIKTKAPSPTDFYKKNTEFPEGTQKTKAIIFKNVTEESIKVLKKSKTIIDPIFTTNNNLVFSQSKFSGFAKKPNTLNEKSKNSSIQSLPNIQEAKTLEVSKTRAKVQYFRKQFTKCNSSLCLLDFWSNGMIVNASHMMNKKQSVAEIHQKIALPTLKRKASILYDKKESLALHERNPKDLEKCLDKLDRFCEETLDETLKLKDQLNDSLLNLRN